MELYRLLLEEPDLGKPHRMLPDLSGKVILVIGGSRMSGFGYNLGKVAATEANAKVILTASKESSRRRLLRRGSFDFQAMLMDVRKDSDYPRLESDIRDSYGRLDAVVVAPAYLNPEFLRVGQNWCDIPREHRDECMAVTVHPTRKVLDHFSGLLSESGGVVYGVSFPLKDLPGYTIGYAKGVLEKMIVDELAPEYSGAGIRVNVLSIGPFDSVSSSVIPGYQILSRLSKVLDCNLPGLGFLVRESVCAIPDGRTGHVYVIDGGLSEAVGKYGDRVRGIINIK